MNFVAIDFETATGKRESACALGIVTVAGGEITEAWHTLIKPPDNQYWRMNIEVNGICPAITKFSPDFAAFTRKSENACREKPLSPITKASTGAY